MQKILALTVLCIGLTLPSAASQRIVVNLSEQRACAYESGRAVFCGNISSGKPGHRTPTGRFRVLEKDIDHVSSKYPEPNGGAKMHYMLRVTGSGIAMHLGHVPNYPASHGCIRMQNGFAQRMYRWAHVGTPVSVIGSPPRRVNRSAFSGTYAMRPSARRMSPNDILADFMGIRTGNNISTRTGSRTRPARKRRRRTRHQDPLKALAAN